MKRRAVAGVVLAIIVSMMVPLIAVGGDAGPAAASLPPSAAHGVNFLLESLADTTFCIDAGAGVGEGRLLTLQPCTTADSERWVLSDEASGDNEMLDSQGMCADVRGRTPGDGLSVAVYLCRHDRAQTLSYTVSGQLEFAKTGACLSVPGGAANAAVSLAICDVTKAGQRWKLAH